MQRLGAFVRRHPVVIAKDDIAKVAHAVAIGRHPTTVALTQELVDLACILYALLALRGGHADVPAAGAAPSRLAAYGASRSETGSSGL